MTTVKIPPAQKNTGIEARCAATGMRMTEQRRVIARVLAEAMDHPRRRGALPPLRGGRRQRSRSRRSIAPSSCSRTRGSSSATIFREGRARYEQMTARSHHDHLINLRDGKVIEFTSEEIEKLQAEIPRKLGYKLVDHRLELYCVPLDEDGKT